MSQTMVWCANKTSIASNDKRWMSASEDLLELIQGGETARVEFKSSLRFDIQKQQVNKNLQIVIAKSICGFLNGNGGTLIIGIADDGSILGIQNDINSISKKSIDGFEQTLRTVIGKYLGVDVSAEIVVHFVKIENHDIARVNCKTHPEPVYLKDGDRYEFYVRDGNSTRPLNVMEANKYISRHFPSTETPTRSDIKDIVDDALEKQRTMLATRTVPQEPHADKAMWYQRIINFFRRPGGLPPIAEVDGKVSPTQFPASRSAQKEDSAERLRAERLPPWLKVRTRNVLNAFLQSLADAEDWKKIYIISPWLSLLDENFALDTAALASRLKDYGTTVYLVTRPPEQPWHKAAIEAFAATNRVNIATVPDLHAKLYTASTATGSFALVSSANFTQKSAQNPEIGLLVSSFMDGKRVISALDHEASGMYRIRSRTLIKRASF